MSHILVVDDDDSVRILISRMLEMSGFTITATGSATAAKEIWSDNTNFDLLVADMNLKETDGKQLADQLRQTKADLKVLMISGYQADDSGMGLNQPGVGFIAKPFTREALVNEAQRLIDS